jgi:hypothetical protein
VNTLAELPCEPLFQWSGVGRGKGLRGWLLFDSLCHKRADHIQWVGWSGEQNSHGCGGSN